MAYYSRLMRREHVKERVERMSFASRTVFAMCCVTHGRDAFINCVDNEYRDWYLELVPMIDEFWEAFPKSLDLEWLHQHKIAADGLLNWEEPSALGEDELKRAASCAFNCANPVEGVLDTIEAGHQLYWALEQALFIEKGEGTDEEWLTELESQDATCLAEIDFQMKCLQLIENWQVDLPNYEQVLQAIGGNKSQT